MSKGIKRTVFLVLLLIFVGSTGYIGYSMWQYKANEQFYTQMADQYIQPAAAEGGAAGQESVTAPITVDFAALQQRNPDVVGWIYCEDSVINYPILRGEDNDFYLHHDIDGKESRSGSIFMDTENAADFSNLNTVLYGHHMKDKSMFASIEYWADQAYFESHPVMWILTPNQDYRVDLFSGYTISAFSDNNPLFAEPGEEFDSYLQDMASRSDFQAEVGLEGDAHYVLLSTCAYSFEDARYVLHGKLAPINSAGGMPTN